LVISPNIISFIHSGYFYSASKTPLLYSEALSTKHGYCAGISREAPQATCGLF